MLFATVLLLSRTKWLVKVRIFSEVPLASSLVGVAKIAVVFLSFYTYNLLLSLTVSLFQSRLFFSQLIVYCFFP